MREMPVAELVAIRDELMREHADAIGRTETLDELYPLWRERFPSLACALTRLASQLLVAICVCDDEAEKAAIREVVASAGCTLEGGPSC